MRQLTASSRALLDTTDADVRAWWAAGAWHRLTPVLQVWAWAAVPLTYGFSEDDVEDFISRAVLRAWTSPYVPNRPRTWVVTMVLNMARDTQKLALRDSTRDTDAADRLISPYPADAWIDDEAHRERMTRLRAAMRELPDPLRRCIALHDLHGRTLVDVAQQLGLTVGAVKMRLVRGRRVLAQLYHAAPTPVASPVAVSRGRPPRPAPSLHLASCP